MRFEYHMRGAHINALYVLIEELAGIRLRGVSTIQGQRGNAWLDKNLQLNLQLFDRVNRKALKKTYNDQKKGLKGRPKVIC